LPVLNKIVKKFLLLENYQLESQNFSTMTKALPAFIPNSMNKIALVDNKLNDQSIADLFSQLATIPIGPKVVAIVQNFVANETWKSVATFLGSEAATGLTRLIFKDPIYLGNKKPLNINTFSKDLPDCGR